jgi:ribosomal protein S18 acetylase RimI-like enzyme
MSLRRRLATYARDCQTFPADAALAYRTGGLRGVWDAFARRTLQRLVRTGRLVVFAQPLDGAPSIEPPDGVTISPITAAECDALATLVPGRELDRFRTLLSTGHHCLVAWRRSDPIGYAWVAEWISPDVTMVPLPLPAHAAYLWDLYVLPAERCNGIGSALASARCQVARGRGFREGWRTIEPSNHASIKTLTRSGPGARIVGDVRYLKLIARMYTRFTPSTAPAEAAQ